MLGATLDAAAYLQRVQQEVDRVSQADLARWSDTLFTAWQDGKSVFIIGNGGSATTASHMAEDLGKSTLVESDLHDESLRRLKVLSLTDNVGWLTAIANDLDYDQVFVQQLMNYGSAGDLLLAISGSGNSANVLNAVAWANRHQLATFGLTGYDGGQLKQIQQDGLHLQLDDMGMVESIHLCLFHWVLNDLFARINRCGRYADE
jgi:D-sedoheptulose 7-phosphate isomerase